MTLSVVSIAGTLLTLKALCLHANHAQKVSPMQCSRLPCMQLWYNTIAQEENANKADLV